MERTDFDKLHTIPKTLHQRKIEYEAARARIFGYNLKKETRNFKKISKLRKRDMRIKIVKKRIVETVIRTEKDNRYFAKTLVGGREVMALLDSGAGACCIGRNSLQFLAGMEKIL